AEGTVRTVLGRDGAGDGGYLVLIHVPGLGGHVEGLRELVVPGDVVLLEVVEGVLAVVDPVGTSVEVIVRRLSRIADACGRGGLGVRAPGGDVVAGGGSGLNEPLGA